MATISASWNGGAGTWFDGGNWTEPNPAPPPNVLHYVPNANNDVFISDASGVGTPFVIGYAGTSTVNTVSATGSSTIDISAGSLSVASGNSTVGMVNLASGTSLGVTAGTLSLNGGNFAGTVAGNGTLRLVNGTLNLNAGVVLNVAEILLTYQVGSATVSTTNLNTDLTYSQAFLLAQVFGNYPILNLNSHTLTLSGGSTLDGTISGPGTISVTGTAALSGSVAGGAKVSVANTVYQVGGLNLDGTLVVASGASYEILKASTIANGGNASTENHGTFTVSGSGFSEIDGDFANDATLSIGGGAMLNLAAGKQTIAGTVSGAGTLAFGFAHDATITSQNITVAGITIAGGNGGGRLTIASELVYGGSFSFSNPFGTLDLGSHTLILGGSAINLDAGNIVGPGTLKITGTATVGSVSIGYNGTAATLENAGTTKQNGSLSLNGTLLNDAGNTYTLNSDVNANIVDNGATVTNNGTFAVTGKGFATVGGIFNNAGTLAIGTGASLTLSGNTETLAGAITGGGTLALGFAHNTTINTTNVTVANISVNGGNGGGTLTLGNDLAYANSFGFTDQFGVLALNGRTLTLSGISYFAGGNIEGAGTVKVTGSSTIGGIRIGYNGKGATFENAGTITQNGNFNLNGTLLNDAGKSYTLTAGYLINNSQAVVTNGGTLSIVGTGTSSIDGTFTNAAGGTLDIGAGAVLRLFNKQTLGGTVTGAGALALGGTSLINTAISTASLEIAGFATLGVDLTYKGNFTFDAFDRIMLAGHTLTLAGTSTLTAGYNDIEGPGTLKITGTAALGGFSVGSLGAGATIENAGSVTQSGTISLAGTLLNDAGKTYTLTAGANITSNGATVTNNGTLSVTGTGISEIDSTFTNAGAITVGSGAVLRLRGTESVGAVSGEGGLILAGSATVTAPISTASLAFSGTTTLGVDLAYAGSFSFDAFDRINLNGHTLTLGGASTLTAGYNDIEGPGTLKITGSATLGGFSVGSAGAGATIENAGSVSQISSLSVTGMLLNDAGHVWTLASASDISGSASFANSGSFVDAAAGTSTIRIAFSNDGSVVANQGSLVFSNGFTNTGLVGGGAGTLTFAGGFTNIGVVRGVISENGSQTTVTADAAGQSHFTGGSGNNVIVVTTVPTFVDGGAGSDTLEIAASMKLAAGSLKSIEAIQVDDGVTADLSNLGSGQTVNLASKAGGTSTVVGTAFVDSFKGGAGNDRYYVNDALDSVKEASGGGSDVVYASANYTLGAGQEIEFLAANAGSKALTLTGNALANTLISGAGNDTLVGGAGNDSYNVNGAGDKIVEQVGGGFDSVFSSVDYTLAAGQEIEQLFANAGNTGLTLTGNELANRIVGGAGADHLYGGGGRDVLEGRGGADIMEGGAGDDLYYLDSSSDQVIEAVGGGLDNVYTSASFTLAAGQEVEFLRANAGATGLTLTGNAFSNSLVSGGGIDTLIGGGGNDAYSVNDAGDQVIEQVGGGLDTVFASVSYTLAAGQEIEYLKANAGSVGLTLTGNAFNNTLYSGNGNDTLIGAGGNDTYYVNNTADVVKEAVGGGTDTIYAGANFTLGAGQEVEFLRANAGATGLTLTGNEFANGLIGGVGNDTLVGGAGNDTYTVDNAGDRVIEQVGGGSDTVYASVSYTLGAGQEIETLRAAGTTGLSLTGNAIANTIIGGAGNDVIAGGGGADVLRGAGGADSFVFKALSDSVVGAGRATISDFTAGADHIDLSAIQAVSGAGSDQAFGFIGTGSFTKHAGELHQVTSGGSTLVEGDVNGDGAADFQIALTGAITLQASDFML